MDFARHLVDPPVSPFSLKDNGANAAASLFITTCRAFCAAGNDGRRLLFAPVLASAADLVEQLLERAP
jgi:hypothetical protein